MTLRFRKINRDIFDAIESGKKKVETRAATTKYLKIHAGDIATFVCDKERFSKKIARVKVFKTVRGMLKKYKPKEINPKAKTSKDLLKIYYSFPGYKEKIKKYGIVAMELV